ncbi:MAG: hypothetical protein ACRDYZ_13530 [Acidimicrobiales bacterium]
MEPASSLARMVTVAERMELRRSAIGRGLLLTLVVAVPTLVLAEDWHGRPLIDQGGYGWLAPAAVVALAFVAGGVLTGRRSADAGRAVGRGLAVGVLAVAILLAGDVVRRVLMNPTLPMGVVDYWIEAAAASVSLAVAGAVAGHRSGRDRLDGHGRRPGGGSAPGGT